MILTSTVRTSIVNTDYAKKKKKKLKKKAEIIERTPYVVRH